MLRLRTLTARFGALYLFTICVVAVLTAVVLRQMASIRVDLARVMEETREQLICSQLVSAVRSADALVAEPGPLDGVAREHASSLVAEALELVASLGGDESDPSTAAHQEEEDLITEELARRLRELARAVEGPLDEDGEDELRAALATAEASGRALLEEAREEAEEASAELALLTETSERITTAAVAVAALLLLVSLGLGRRWIIRPIQHLRDGAERLGRGERGHRIHHSGQDELDDLAATFNAMAARIAESQEDLEERVRARTDAFVRAARLADLGVLASGIAHEINTPLGSITSCAEGLRRRVERGELNARELDEYTGTIRDEAFRARDITRRMLDLVRQEPGHVSTVRVADLVDQASAAVSHLVRAAGVELRTRVEGEAELHVSRGELVQVLVNLLSNAIDASDAGDVVTLVAAVAERNIEFRVEDEGAGIAPENLDRIFEPFFTTKGSGRGTGLGLALVATLLESRGGSIDVAGRHGGGTEFRVMVPRDWRTAA